MQLKELWPVLMRSQMNHRTFSRGLPFASRLKKPTWCGFLPVTEYSGQLLSES